VFPLCILQATFLYNPHVSEGYDKATGPRILVIDDDAIMRDLMTDWLEAAGYGVLKATNCHGGIEALKRAAPALIVCDMFMPGPCGVSAITQMKAAVPGVRLIAVSGHFKSGQGLSAEEALEAGAVRAFAKPVKRAELVQAVAELLGPPSH
jgi:CheY-like chemotaxis protein